MVSGRPTLNSGIGLTGVVEKVSIVPTFSQRRSRVILALVAFGTATVLGVNRLDQTRGVRYHSAWAWKNSLRSGAANTGNATAVNVPGFDTESSVHRRVAFRAGDQVLATARGPAPQSTFPRTYSGADSSTRPCRPTKRDGVNGTPTPPRILATSF